MARIFITGSTDGLGRAAARTLLDDGHRVVLHARTPARAASVDDLAVRAAGVVVGDLASAEETGRVADQVNAIGRMDAVIHNAAIFIDARRVATAEGHARTLAVNVLAPYVLTATIDRPSRLVYMASGMHRDGDASLRDIDWTARRWSGVQAYSDSKLLSSRSRWRSRAGGPACAAMRSTRGGCRPGWAGRARRTTSNSVTSPRCGSRPVTNRRRAAVAGTGITSAGTRPPRQPPMSVSKMPCSAS